MFTALVKNPGPADGAKIPQLRLWVCAHSQTLGSDVGKKQWRLLFWIWARGTRTLGPVLQSRGWQTFSVTGQIVNISGFVGHMQFLSHILFFNFKQLKNVKTRTSLVVWWLQLYPSMSGGKGSIPHTQQHGVANNK